MWKGHTRLAYVPGDCKNGDKHQYASIVGMALSSNALVLWHPAVVTRNAKDKGYATVPMAMMPMLYASRAMSAFGCLSAIINNRVMIVTTGKAAMSGPILGRCLPNVARKVARKPERSILRRNTLI